MSDAVEPWLRAILRCPICHATLTDVLDSAGAPALACDGDCRETGQPSTYRIDDGIPVLLPAEAGPRRA